MGTPQECCSCGDGDKKEPAPAAPAAPDMGGMY